MTRMKRSYKAADVAPAGGGYGVTLDGKPLRTPAKAPLTVPSRALAEAIAAEWRAQGEEIELAALPLTRLASTGIDLVTPRRAEVAAEVARYAGTDLVCYRAGHPPQLARRQHAAWQPLIDWATLRYESFEIELWGEDAELAQRRVLLQDDIALARRFIDLLRT